MPLDDFPIVVTVPVQWGDQDALGHVNNTVPLKWLESARVKYLEELLIRTPDDQPPLASILAAVSCNFRRQLKYPDTVQIGARLVKIGNTSLTLEHHVYSEHLDDVAADGQSVIVQFDYQSQTPTQISAEIRNRIAQLEGKRPNQL